MLALRLARGSRPLGLISRLLVAGAAAGVGFLLLGALGHALAHPARPGESARLLLWCTVPLAAVVQFATAVACADPGERSRSALDAVGMGPSRLPFLAAVSTAVACLLGSTLALLVHLHLRGDLTGMPFDGAAAELLAADRPLPLAATLTLLCLAPAVASVSAALTTRTRAGDRARDVRETDAPEARDPGVRRGQDVRTVHLVTAGRKDGGASVAQCDTVTGTGTVTGTDSGTAPGDGTASDSGTTAGGDTASDNGTAADDAPDTAPVSVPPPGMHPAGIAPPHRPAPEVSDVPRAPSTAALPWGVALAAGGLALELYTAASPASASGSGDSAALPAGAVVGCLFAAFGLVLAGPGLVHLAGRLLTLGRPAAVRLLSGRALQQDAGRIGRPVGVLAAVSACGLLAAEVRPETLLGVRDAGPLPALGAALVVCCTVASALTVAAETHDARTPSTATLVRLGAPKQLLWTSVAVRAGALAVLVGVPAWVLGMLAALPLR